jgi:DNA-binding transcriptional MerR regulator
MATRTKPLTVSQVARLAKVSVRTLHHYDALGLLKPSGRSSAGYRLYTAADLERLQQVLFFRELDFPLERIVHLVGNPSFDVKEALTLQRKLLTERAAKTKALLEAVDRALEAHTKGAVMTPEERFEVFGEFKPEEHEAEAKARWGDTPAWKEAQRRTKRYGKEDWERIKAEAGAISLGLAALMAKGVPPTSAEAKALAERHRLHLDARFYPCSHAMHRGLGDLYVQDPRFAANYERVRPGLAQYFRDAIHANADEHA